MTNQRYVMIHGFRIEDKGRGMYKFMIGLLGEGSYSMLSSDAKLVKSVESARESGDEERIYNAILKICRMVLIHNDVYFDEIEII